MCVLATAASPKQGAGMLCVLFGICGYHSRAGVKYSVNRTADHVQVPADKDLVVYARAMREMLD